MKIILSFILTLMTIIVSIGCGNNETAIVVSKEQKEKIVQIDAPKSNVLSKFSKEDVARFAISSIMGQSSNSMKVKFERDIYYVSYLRKSDLKKFSYRIKIEGNRILWANVEGRWRDSEHDEKISFQENDNTLSIIQTYNDGSTDIKEFKKGE